METLIAQIAALEKDHEIIDALIDKGIGMASVQHPCAGDFSETCRMQARDTLGKYLAISMRHFDREHRLMHAIHYPRDVVEAHAIEHDKLLTMVNQAIQDMNDRRPNLGKSIERLAEAYRDHRDSIDARLEEYIAGIAPPPPK